MVAVSVDQRIPWSSLSLFPVFVQSAKTTREFVKLDSRSSEDRFAETEERRKGLSKVYLLISIEEYEKMCVLTIMYVSMPPMISSKEDG